MKIKNLLIFLFWTSFISSCNDEKQIKNVTCTPSAEYAYLDKYVMGTPCTDSLCVAYQNIWKQLFMEKNDLTEGYFNKHIELFGSEISDWNDGTSFGICYKVKVDWAIAYNCDQFIIKIKEGNNIYPSLNLPRGTYLTKGNVKTVIHAQAFSSDITKLSNSEILKFNSFDNALTFLTNKAGANKLCSREISVDDSTGGLILECWAQYENEDNKCIDAKIDLINGSTSIVNTLCAIN